MGRVGAGIACLVEGRADKHGAVNLQSPVNGREVVEVVVSDIGFQF